MWTARVHFNAYHVAALNANEQQVVVAASISYSSTEMRRPHPLYLPVIWECLGHVQIHWGGGMVRSGIRVLPRLHHGAGGRSSRRRGRRMMVTQDGRPGRRGKSPRMIQLESSTHTRVHQLAAHTST